jgi:hypothetical protein
MAMPSPAGQWVAKKVRRLELPGEWNRLLRLRLIPAMQVEKVAHATHQENHAVGRARQTLLPIMALPLGFRAAPYRGFRGLRVAQVFNLCLPNLKSCATTSAAPPATIFAALRA